MKQQFESIQKEHAETWNAFLRRIHNVHKYTKQCVFTCSIDEYLEGALDDVENPFID